MIQCHLEKCPRLLPLVSNLISLCSSETATTNACCGREVTPPVSYPATGKLNKQEFSHLLTPSAAALCHFQLNLSHGAAAVVLLLWCRVARSTAGSFKQAKEKAGGAGAPETRCAPERAALGLPRAAAGLIRARAAHLGSCPHQRGRSGRAVLGTGSWRSVAVTSLRFHLCVTCQSVPGCTIAHCSWLCRPKVCLTRKAED